MQTQSQNERFSVTLSNPVMFHTSPTFEADDRLLRQEPVLRQSRTEESGRLDGDPDWQWIVDSLDGTSDFANLNPFFCVCLALMHKKELVLGGVYAPAIDELYLAEKGKGAYLNSKKLSVSQVSNLRESYVFYCEGG